MQFRIGEPNCQQQGQQDLRNEVTKPQDDGVLERCQEQILHCSSTAAHAFARTEQDDAIVVESDKVTGISAVTLETQDKGLDQRPYLEETIHEKERGNEHIAILRIANRLDSTLCSGSHLHTPFQKFSRIVREKINIRL